jgi:hypothetical protein
MENSKGAVLSTSAGALTPWGWMRTVAGVKLRVVTSTSIVPAVADYSEVTVMLGTGSPGSGTGYTHAEAKRQIATARSKRRIMTEPRDGSRHTKRTPSCLG